MTQKDINRIEDHAALFQQADYQQMLKNKKAMEGCHPPEKVEEIAEWTKGWDYREKNFAREALTVNPAKACQPLGSLLCSLGFQDTLNFIHGSQGCAAYFRSHLTRHFNEPVSAVSSSMTEDAAVFGGMNNMVEGLANAYALYKPQMIAVSTTCMAEVIGDDLNSFIIKAKESGSVPEDFPVPFAHTPSFVGSHIVGYDNMLKSILDYLTKGKKRGQAANRINLIPGFETYTGNLREVKRLMGVMGVDSLILSDPTENLDSPNLGEFKMYQGGTPLKEVAKAVDAKATFAFQQYSTEKTQAFISKKWEQPVEMIRPMGIQGTDKFLMRVSELTGHSIPPELEDERGRAVDALTDSHAWLHGKRVALYGDPDLLMGLIGVLLEMGAEPVHVLCSNGSSKFEEEATALLASSPYGANAKVWVGKDLWHMRSLMFTEPVDFLIGNSYAKYLWRDTGTPLIRIGYPLFDRHHLHRFPIYGYQGVINLVTLLVNAVLDELDRKTIDTAKTDYSFDLVR